MVNGFSMGLNVPELKQFPPMIHNLAKYSMDSTFSTISYMFLFCHGEHS
jgi:hypothetical protein